jgi:hypothetical protein
MLFTKLESDLRSIARQRIQQGQLPCVVPSKIWAGRSAGQSCALCDQPIPSGEVEYEVEEIVQGVARTFRFHRHCQTIWQIECVS